VLVLTGSGIAVASCLAFSVVETVVDDRLIQQIATDRGEHKVIKVINALSPRDRLHFYRDRRKIRGLLVTSVKMLVIS